MGKQVKEPQEGDLVIFKQTYDAVPPAGIGPEDDKTHVGIFLGSGKFAHFSASADKPMIEYLAGWWNNHVEAFIRLTDPETGQVPEKPDPVKPGLPQTPAASGETANTAALKLFYHPAPDRPNVIIGGKEEPVSQMLLTIRTVSGREIMLTSHRFERYPSLTIDGIDYPVKFIGPRGFEYIASQ